MRNLSLQSGIGADPAYLNGNLVDNQTIIGEGINQDLVQFFQKLAALASITPNNLPDNETNGYQLITAFEAVVRAYAASTTQRGTSERATQTEVNTGTDTERYIAPNTLRGTTFVDSQIPLLNASKIPNLNASKITTGIFDPAIIPQATESTLGGGEIATQVETDAGSDDTKFITPLKLANYANFNIKRAYVQIGSWDMDNVIGVNVSWTVPADHIVIGCKAVIFYDGTTAYSFPLDLIYLGSPTNPLPSGGIQQYHGSPTYEFELRRTSGGFFDQAAFSGAANRGYILVEYIHI